MKSQNSKCFQYDQKTSSQIKSAKMLVFEYIKVKKNKFSAKEKKVLYNSYQVKFDTDSRIITYYGLFIYDL